MQPDIRGVGLCFKGDEVLAKVEWVTLFGDDVLTVQDVENTHAVI